MNVDAIITHLENFQNTWKGWGDFLGGLVKFFGKGEDNVVNHIIDFFSGLKDLKDFELPNK